MTRGVTLATMLTNYRAEARISQLTAHNTVNRSAQIALLQRKIEWFWDDFDWPHLRVDRFVEISAGQRYYSLPADLDIGRIQRVAARFDAIYETLPFGIDEPHYAAYDSDLDARSWPIQRVRISEDEKLEVWPIPSEDFDAATLEGQIKITAIKKLPPFAADTDTCVLDDRLIVLHAAAETLASTGAKDAQLKLDQATKLYGRLRAGLMPRRKYSGMFTNGRCDGRPDRVPIAVYRAAP